MRDRYNTWAKSQIEKAEAEEKLKKEEEASRQAKKFDLKSMVDSRFDDILRRRLINLGKNVSDFDVTGFAIGLVYQHNTAVAKVTFTVDSCEWKATMTYPLDKFTKGVDWIPHDVYEKGKIEFVGFVDDFLQAENHKEKIKGE